MTFKQHMKPKDAMGIGLLYPREFTNIHELVDYIMIMLPNIFDGKIPDDILSKKEAGVLPESYYEQIEKFLCDAGHTMICGTTIRFKNVTKFDTEIMPVDFVKWPSYVREELIKKGYKRYGDKYIRGRIFGRMNI